jgi:predicted DNA repair protein MutK
VILIIGGLYLAYEGAEKIYEYFVPHPEKAHVNLNVELTEEQILALEKEKIKSAITTDFILSVEIVIIALGTVVEESLTTQIAVVSVIALLATVGVYGIVGLIVRMDEFGAKLIALNEETDSFSDKVGLLLVKALPLVIRALGFIGTIALLLVSGGIFSHNIEFFHHLLPAWPGIIKEFLIGLVVGAFVLLLVTLVKKVLKKS